MRLFKFGEDVRLKDGSIATFISYYPTVTDERFISNMHQCIVAKHVPARDIVWGRRFTLTGTVTVPIDEVFPMETTNHKTEDEVKMEKKIINIVPENISGELNIKSLQDEIRKLITNKTWLGKPITAVELDIMTASSAIPNTDGSGSDHKPKMLVLEKPADARSIREMINDVCARYYNRGKNALIGTTYVQFISDLSDAIAAPCEIDSINIVNQVLHKNRARYVVVPAMYNDDDRVFLAVSGIDWDSFERSQGYLKLKELWGSGNKFNTEMFENKIIPIVNELAMSLGTMPFLLTDCDTYYDVHINNLRTPKNISDVNRFFVQYGIPYLIRGSGFIFQVVQNQDMNV